jgi:hypothetical protein
MRSGDIGNGNGKSPNTNKLRVIVCAKQNSAASHNIISHHHRGGEKKDKGEGGREGSLEVDSAVKMREEYKSKKGKGEID